MCKNKLKMSHKAMTWLMKRFSANRKLLHTLQKQHKIALNLWSKAKKKKGKEKGNLKLAMS